jgi:hypothetical protein
MKFIVFICLSFIIIIVFTGCQIEKQSHNSSITPEGEKVLSPKQIQNDLSYLFKDKYRPYSSVDFFSISRIIPLSRTKDEEVLKRIITDETDQLVEISLEDKKLRWEKGIDVFSEGQEIVAEQAVQFLLYFLQRDYDPTLKAVCAMYTPRNFDLDANTQASIVIGFDEFIKEWDRLKSEGLNIEDIEKNLVEIFLYFHEFE